LFLNFNVTNIVIVVYLQFILIYFSLYLNSFIHKEKFIFISQTCFIFVDRIIIYSLTSYKLSLLSTYVERLNIFSVITDLNCHIVLIFLICFVTFVTVMHLEVLKLNEVANRWTNITQNITQPTTCLNVCSRF